MSTGKDKIREALESGIIEPGLRKAALAELDKTQQPGKVLTDDEIEAVVEDVREYEGMEDSPAFWEGGTYCLRHARDNGYLAPAAGLTVEEVMQVFDRTCAPDEPARYEFKRGLTAAIEAKSRTA